MVDDAIIFLTNQLNRSLRSLSRLDPSEDKVALVDGGKVGSNLVQAGSDLGFID